MNIKINLITSQKTLSIIINIYSQYKLKIERFIYKLLFYGITMNDKTIFLQMFGDSPILRVLDFLIVNEEFDYSMTDIAKLSGVGYSTLKLFWSNLEKHKIIVNTREVGKAKMYKLNLENPIVKRFRDFYFETTKQKIHSLIKEKVKVEG